MKYDLIKSFSPLLMIFRGFQLLFLLAFKGQFRSYCFTSNVDFYKKSFKVVMNQYDKIPLFQSLYLHDKERISLNTVLYSWARINSFGFGNQENVNITIKEFCKGINVFSDGIYLCNRYMINIDINIVNELNSIPFFAKIALAKYT